MTSFIVRLVSVAICSTLFGAVLATGQHRRQDQPLTDELYALVEKRTELLKESIASSTNEWAGMYAAGDHHPTILMWTPEAGFLVTSSHHTFAPSWLNYGDASISGSRLSFRPTLPKGHQYAHDIESEFRLVKWGKQHFLIPYDDLRQFAYAVHSQAESEIVHYFVKWKDNERPRQGLPDLPAEFTKILRMRPIVATITRVGREDGFDQDVTMSVGSRHNIVEGMIFYLPPRRGAQFSIRVTKVSPTTCTGQVWSRGGFDDLKIRPGMKLTSRIPKGFVEPG